MLTRSLCILVLFAAVAQAETAEQAVHGYLLQAEKEAAPKPKKSPWEVVGALGLAVTQNGDNVTLSYQFDANKKFDGDTWILSMALRGIYETSNSATTANEHIFVERLDRKLNEKSSLFQTLWLETDDLEDLDLRVILTVGYSRKLVEKKKFRLSGDAGLGWNYEKFTVTSNNDFIGHLGISWEWQITDQLTYTQRIIYYPKFTSLPDFRFVWESVFSTPVSETMDLRLTILDQYDSNPQPGVSQNDLKVFLNIAIRFTKKTEEKK